MTDRAALLSADQDQSRTWRGLLAWSTSAQFFFYAFVHRVAPSVMVDELTRDFAASGAVVGYLSAVYLRLCADADPGRRTDGPLRAAPPDERRCARCRAWQRRLCGQPRTCRRFARPPPHRY